MGYLPTADFDPGPWKGHDFKSARASYDASAGRSYADAQSSNKTNKDLCAKKVKTNCVGPLVVFCDVTGSMTEWPSVIFSKLPYLEIEGKEYLGDDMEICFGAIGDVFSDNYPLQVRPFSKGLDLKKRLEELVVEGNGGGQVHESYEIAALYSLRNIEMPQAIRSVLIMIGDEAAYEFIDKENARQYAGVAIEGMMSTSEVFEALKQKFAVYFIRKPYGDSNANSMDSTNREILDGWIDLLGRDHVCDLPTADRVVDVIFGILAKETGRVDYFRKEIEGRQEPDQVKTVYKSLKTVHALPKGVTAKPYTGKSIMRKTKGSKKDSDEDAEDAVGETKPLA